VAAFQRLFDCPADNRRGYGVAALIPYSETAAARQECPMNFVAHEVTTIILLLTVAVFMIGRYLPILRFLKPISAL
jgi:hypothetical protein